MEAPNYFTCISYDTVDFLIQSKYVIFGIYLALEKQMLHIDFNDEILPHIYIGSFLENEFSCTSLEKCNVVLVMRMQDFSEDIRYKIEKYTGTPFPPSGNFALSVNSLITSSEIDISHLHLMPKGIRERLKECGVSAIGFIADKKQVKITRKQILLSLDNLLWKFFSDWLKDKNRGAEE